MLTTRQVQGLVEGSLVDRALGGTLLPVNNNASFLESTAARESHFTVTVVDQSEGGKVVAFGLFNKCSRNQAYCSVVSVEKCYQQQRGKFVVVEPVVVENTGKQPNNNQILLKVLVAKKFINKIINNKNIIN